jgi:NAD(P)-dependent dehydrogenase (short-subunit alcohol dehydrogenase family)
MTTIKGSVALVTGASGGIGRAIVAALRAAGATVVTSDRPGCDAECQADVRDFEQVQRVVDTTRERHGRLDLVVANAGMAVAGTAETVTDDDWQRTIDVNLWGTVHTARAAYPVMVEQGRGHLVLVASLAGLVPLPLLVPYATAKHAVVGLGTSLALEGKRHGVRTTVVCPGPVDTSLLDTGGAGGVVRGVDVRRYLTAAAGPAMAPAALATALVRGVEHERLLVAPGRAGLIWRVGRWSPALLRAAIGYAHRQELSVATKAGTTP